DLNPDTVELPLDRRELEARNGTFDALGRRGEHREDGTEELETDRRKGRLASRQRKLGGAGEVAGEHQRPSRARRGNAGRLGDRVDHDPCERALPELAGEEP